MGLPSLQQYQSVRVSKLEKLCANAYLISFPRGSAFNAGQILGLKLEEGDDARYYSIASGEQEAEIALLFDVKPGGSFSPRLAATRAGDRLLVSEPGGQFLGSHAPATWIATGTGIAPFRSMFRSGLGLDKTLIQGAPGLDTLYFQEEFAQGLGNHYIPCLSRETVKGCFAGRVTDYLRQIPVLDVTRLYYLCGSAEMVVDTREILLERGIPFGNIMAEIYF